LLSSAVAGDEGAIGAVKCLHVGLVHIFKSKAKRIRDTGIEDSIELGQVQTSSIHEGSFVEISVPRSVNPNLGIGQVREVVLLADG